MAALLAALLAAPLCAALSVSTPNGTLHCGGTATVCSVLPDCLQLSYASAARQCALLGNGFILCNRAQLQAGAGFNITSPKGSCPSTNALFFGGISWLNATCSLGTITGHRVAYVVDGSAPYPTDCESPTRNAHIGACCADVTRWGASLSPTSLPVQSTSLPPSAQPSLSSSAAPTSASASPTTKPSSETPASSAPLATPAPSPVLATTGSPAVLPSSSASPTSGLAPTLQTSTSGPSASGPTASPMVSSTVPLSPSSLSFAPPSSKSPTLEPPSSSYSLCNSTCQGLAAGLAILLVALIAVMGVWFFYLPPTQQPLHVDESPAKDFFTAAPTPATYAPPALAATPAPVVMPIEPAAAAASPPSAPADTDASINDLEAAMAAQLTTNNELKTLHAALQRRVDALGAF